MIKLWLCLPGLPLVSKLSAECPSSKSQYLLRKCLYLFTLIPTTSTDWGTDSSDVFPRAWVIADIKTTAEGRIPLSAPERRLLGLTLHSRPIL